MQRFLFAAAMAISPAAKADLVADWNQYANTAMIAEGPAIAGNPLVMSRTLAIMHLAMYQAIAQGGRKDGQPAGAPGAAPEAAAHAAAHMVLASLYPKQKDAIDRHYGEALAGAQAGDGRAAAIASGEAAARLVLAQRQNDGTIGAADTYRPYAAPGVYVPTGLPVVSNIALRKPFSLAANAQFRPPPPPALDSAVWARDFNETKEWGAIDSTRRSPRQSETARFWEQLGPPAWNQVARILSGRRTLALADNARTYALLNVALFDAYLAVFDAKYHYNFWRPITAIRNGDQDGNPATERDPAWRPLIDTPPHPEYPCAHCAADGAAAVVLTAAYGDRQSPAFVLDFRAMPGTTREYDSIRQLVDEVAMARIWGGVHYRNSNQAGEKLGASVGQHVLSTMLPSRHP
ncbi:vanadium-dependent haloperoxidase [Oxalobacteraceae bacterium A2-2]